MTAPQTVADVQSLDVLYNEGSDSVVLADPVSHDDIAEVFHNERHTVTQTVEQALVIAQRFAASELLLEACKAIVAYDEADDTGPHAGIQMMVNYDNALTLARAALRAAATSARQGETK